MSKLGKARYGRRGEAGPGLAWLSTAWQARRGRVRRGKAGRSVAWRGKAGGARTGLAWHGMAGKTWAVHNSVRRRSDTTQDSWEVLAIG